MLDKLRPSDPNWLLNVWADELEACLKNELAIARPGHCLRVTDLPRSLLEMVIVRLLAETLLDAEGYLVDGRTGPEPWRVGVHKVVERRNAEENIVLALFPPDLQVAAGDSVDVSTFREIPVRDLQSGVERALLERIAANERRRATEVLAHLSRQQWLVSPTDRLAYLATVAQQPGDEPAAVGGALFQLGLIPDFGLLDKPEELPYRLGHRNVTTVRRISEEGTTDLERILRLPLHDEALRLRLLEFFRDHKPEDVRAWGQLVATDSTWRDLALEHWRFDQDGRPPAGLRIDIGPLRLPRRKEDGHLILESSGRVVVGWQTDPKPLNVPGLAYFRVEILSADRVVVW